MGLDASYCTTTVRLLRRLRNARGSNTLLCAKKRRNFTAVTRQFSAVGQDVWRVADSGSLMCSHHEDATLDRGPIGYWLRDSWHAKVEARAITARASLLAPAHYPASTIRSVHG